MFSTPQPRVRREIGAELAEAATGNAAAIASVVAYFSRELLDTAHHQGAKDPVQVVHRSLTRCLAELSGAGRSTEFGFRLRLLRAVRDEVANEDRIPAGVAERTASQTAEVPFSEIPTAEVPFPAGPIGPVDLATVTQEFELMTAGGAPLDEASIPNGGAAGGSRARRRRRIRRAVIALALAAVAGGVAVVATGVVLAQERPAISGHAPGR